MQGVTVWEILTDWVCTPVTRSCICRDEYEACDAVEVVHALYFEGVSVFLCEDWSGLSSEVIEFQLSVSVADSHFVHA